MTTCDIQIEFQKNQNYKTMVGETLNLVISVPRTFARPELCTGQSHNLKYYDSILGYTSTNLSLPTFNVWQIATSYQSQSISIFWYVWNTSIMPVCIILPKSFFFLFFFFNSYRSWTIYSIFLASKMLFVCCILLTQLFWLFWAFFVVFVSFNFFSYNSVFYIAKNILLVSFYQALQNFNSISGLASWFNID